MITSLGQANIQAVEKLMQTKHSIFYQILEKSVRIQYQQWDKGNHTGPTPGKGIDLYMGGLVRLHTENFS